MIEFGEDLPSGVGTAGDPDPLNPTLSADGTLLAYAAPAVEGVMNVWIRPTVGDGPVRPVTWDRGRGITEFAFCGTAKLIYRQHSDQSQNWLYLLDLTEDQDPQPVTPEPGAHGPVQVLANHPG